MKRAANYKKMALIERGELDRLRQRQIKEYNPILSQLSSIQQEIERVLRSNQLSIEERLGVLNLLHSRFDNLYKTLKYNGGLSIPTGAPVPIIQPIPGAFAPPNPAAQAAAPQILAGPGAAPAFEIQQAAPVAGPFIDPQAEGAAGLMEPIADPLEGDSDGDEFPRAGVPQGKHESPDEGAAANFESRAMQTPKPVNFPEIKNLKLHTNFEKKV